MDYPQKVSLMQKGVFCEFKESSMFYLSNGVCAISYCNWLCHNETPDYMQAFTQLRPGLCFNIKTIFSGMHISTIKIKWSHNLYSGNLYTSKRASLYLNNPLVMYIWIKELQHHVNQWWLIIKEQTLVKLNKTWLLRKCIRRCHMQMSAILFTWRFHVLNVHVMTWK